MLFATSLLRVSFFKIRIRNILTLDIRCIILELAFYRAAFYRQSKKLLEGNTTTQAKTLGSLRRPSLAPRTNATKTVQQKPEGTAVFSRKNFTT